MKHQKHEYTRQISPKLGILGFTGFLGLIGFLPQLLNTNEALPVPTFFFFFAFFGFFGFYYEGKMSDTLIDERFQLNVYRAESLANKTALSMIILVAILILSILRFTLYNTLSLLIATIAFAFGLAIFLKSYLLYKFENEE